MKTRAFIFAVFVSLAFSWMILASTGKAAGNEPPDFGDLFVLYRDGSGVPILTADLCQQPLAAAPFPGCIETLEGDCLVIPVDPETCTVPLEYAIYTQEVDFGRINEIRSPDAVLAAQLEDALLKLATAGCVTLDPAGRLVCSNLTEDGVDSHTIDSPLQNLALYRQLMRTGTLAASMPLTHDWQISAAQNHGAASEKEAASLTLLPHDWQISAARSLGAASDKDGAINVDLVVYINEILGLTAVGGSEVFDRICIHVREEIKGKVQLVEHCFLDFSGFAYNRAANFSALPDPPYIVYEGEVTAGYFEYLAEVDPTPTYGIFVGPILGVVPELAADTGLVATDVGGFAQAADDTRAVIDFLHSWAVSEEAATPIPCEAGPAVYYDVFISDVSGLHVPKRMVADTEGREGTVTVTNSGPAKATGTVMVTGTDANNASIGPLYAVIDGVVTEDHLFDEPESFALPAGYSQSWTFFFSMAEATTISWQATADAEHDVNTANNTVYESTTVTLPSGGGKDH